MNLVRIKTTCLIALLSIITGIFGIPEANAIDIDGNELGITLDFTYTSKYMWHGFCTYTDPNLKKFGAFQPSTTFTFMGFNAGVWASWPDSTGFEKLTEIDYYFGYGRSLFIDEPYQLDLSLLYTYFSYPKTNDSIDLQETSFGISMPNLIPIGPSNLIPTYRICYDWAGIQGENVLPDNGWFHMFGLSYDIPIPALIPEQEKQAITLMWDATYTDGPLALAPGWSYTTVGVSTTFLYKGFYLTPALRYQWGLKEANKALIEDNFYAMVSVGYKF